MFVAEAAARVQISKKKNLPARGASPSVFPAPVMSQLEQLRKHTTVVADSGDFHSYSALKGSIQDGTTNPSVRSALYCVLVSSLLVIMVCLPV